MPDKQAVLPVVAVVGRPNVGKSSLVNRILGSREAIVDAMPGVTRDRMGYRAQWRDREFEILDTGGLEPGAKDLEERVVEQAMIGVEAADLIVLVVDAAAGPVQDDHEVAEVLRRSNKPVAVAANKVDDPKDAPGASAFHRLGLGDVHPVSALHGTGSGDLLDAVIALLPEVGEAPSDDWAAVAVIGRPNVGKSSLLNALVGEYRSIVDPTPGTTRDPVDSVLEVEGRRFRLVDTAGMRRQVKIEDPVEYFSFLRSKRTLERVDAAVLVIDAVEGVTAHDQRLAEEVTEQGRACVVVMNKWDALPEDENDRMRLLDESERRLRFLDWAVRVRTSAITGRGVDKVVPAVTAAVTSHRVRLATPVVNRALRDAQEARSPARTHGKSVRILYGVQAGVAPPTFVLFSSGRPEDTYVRYLEKRLRAAEPRGFAGSPLRVKLRVRTRRKAEV